MAQDEYDNLLRVGSIIRDVEIVKGSVGIELAKLFRNNVMTGVRKKT